MLYQHWLIVAIQLPVGGKQDKFGLKLGRFDTVGSLVLLTMRVYALTRFSKIFLRIISVVIVACVAVASVSRRYYFILPYQILTLYSGRLVKLI